MSELNEKSVAAILSDDPSFAAAVSTLVTDQIDKKIKDREDRLLRILGAIAALVVFFGYSGIKELIGSAALSAVQSAFEKRTSELEAPVYMATLATYVAKAENSGRFSNTERSDMMSALERLADLRKKGVDLGDSSFFSSTLEAVIDTMAASDNDYYVDRIFDLYTDDCLKVSSIVQTLSQHYGRQMLSGVGDIRVEAKRRFQLSERAASTHKITGFTLIHRALFDFKEAGGRRNKGSDEAVALLISLKGDSKDMAWKFLREYQSESWVKQSSGESRALKFVASAFAKEYSKELEVSNLANSEKE